MEHTFNAPIHRVFALLTDVSWLETRSRALGYLGVHIQTRVNGKAVAITTKRCAPGTLLPHGTGMTTPCVDLVFREKWNPEFEGVRTGKLTMSAVDQPIRMSASFELVPSGNNSIYRIVHKYKSNVPLTGDAVHKFAQEQIETICMDEFAYLVGYLAGTRK